MEELIVLGGHEKGGLTSSEIKGLQKKKSQIQNIHQLLSLPPKEKGTIILLNCTLWHPTPVLLPGNPMGQRNLVGCSPWGGEESDTTE